jgi:hypothetical protein
LKITAEGQAWKLEQLLDVVATAGVEAGSVTAEDAQDLLEMIRESREVRERLFRGLGVADTVGENARSKRELVGVIRDPEYYPMSRDYGILWVLAHRQGVICVVDNLDCRDVAQTLAMDDTKGSVHVSSRGICYVAASDAESFSKSCREINLEWVLLDSQPRRPPALQVLGQVKIELEKTKTIEGPILLRPLDEWHDDVGEVLWYHWPIQEAPVVTSPLCDDWEELYNDGWLNCWLPLPDDRLMQHPHPPWPNRSSESSS